MTPQDDMPHDAWLRAALRQAPDADARPPEALRSAILRAAAAPTADAGRSVRGSLTAGRSPTAWIRAWRALGRPQIAGAFASFAAMLVAGVLWWGRPLDDALPERTSSIAPILEPAPDLLNSLEARAGASGPAAAGSTAYPERPPRPTVASPSSTDALLRLQRERASEPSQGRSAALRPDAAKAARPGSPVAPPRPVPVPAPAPTETQTTVQTPTPLPASPPIVQSKLSRLTAPTADARRSEASGADANPEPRAEAPIAANAPLAESLRQRFAADSSAAFDRMSRSGLPLKAVAPAKSLQIGLLQLRDELRTPGWGRQRDAGDLRPADPAVERWLELLAASTPSTLSAEPASASTSNPARTGTLRLWRDGRPVHTFRIDTSGVTWERERVDARTVQRIPLGAADIAELARALDRIEP